MLEEAVKNFNQAIKHRPQKVNYYINAGLATDKTGNTYGAIEFYKKALSMEIIY